MPPLGALNSNLSPDVPFKVWTILPDGDVTYTIQNIDDLGLQHNLVNRTNHAKLPAYFIFIRKKNKRSKLIF